ncbi:phosphotransferase [Actinomycetes bacterium KLBMP 9797]
MKTLPDNPNLDHLRQQAKDLLAGLRDTAPATTLAEAQAALAEQYGFRTWTDLKAEVDRVRGKADVADPALATAVAERYGLGAVTAPMRSLARPDELGRRWSLTTERGRWAVRTVDGWIRIVDVEDDVALQRAAAGAGVRVPAPVLSRAGAVVESVGGHRWRVYEWVHTGPPLAAPVSARITREVGRILAALHGLELPVDRISPWHAYRLSPRPWTDLAAAARAHGADWAPALAEALPALSDLEQVGAGAAPGKPVLSHNSLGPGNVRLGAGGQPVVLGWEHAGGQPPAWELADALTTWAVNPDGGVNAAGVRSMLDGYREAAGAVPALDLPAFRGAALSMTNYVMGQIEVALAATGGEERWHADRSVRHLLAHVPTRPTFERLLAAT